MLTHKREDWGEDCHYVRYRVSFEMNLSSELSLRVGNSLSAECVASGSFHKTCVT